MTTKTVTPEQLDEEIMKDLTALFRGVSTESSNSIIDLAPVASGALKASIKAGVNEEISSFGAEQTDPTGDSTKAENEDSIKQAAIGDVVNIVVGAPYGRAVEEGSSTEAPSGFLKITAESLDAIVERVSKNLDRYR